MSLLDELERKAQQQKQREAASAAVGMDIERFYGEVIRPKLDFIYDYLSRLTETLNALKTDTRVDYALDRYAALKNLLQSDYEMNIDSRENMRRLDFDFVCSAEGEVTFRVEGMEAIRHCKEMLTRGALKFQAKNNLASGKAGSLSEFTVRNYVPVRFSFSYEDGEDHITLLVRNFDDVSVRSMFVNPGKVDEEFMERFGRYVLREIDDFMKLEISEEAKHLIQAKLEKEREQYKREMRRAERREAARMARLQEIDDQKLHNRIKRKIKDTVAKPVDYVVEHTSRPVEAVKGFFGRFKRKDDDRQ